MTTIVFAFVGALVGILLNRAADNLPPPGQRSMLETPRCPYCNTRRAPLEQIGVLSFGLRRDKCHQCGAPLTLRAPLVEIGAAFSFAFLAARNEFGIYLLSLCFFTAILILIAVIDLEHKLILDVVTLPATLLALLASPIVLGASDVTLATADWQMYIFSLMGAVVGVLITFGIYWLGVLFLRIVNRNRSKKINTVAFGMGDVKLAGLLGALVGAPGILYVLMYAFLLGGLGALFAIVLQLARGRGFALGMAIPYGPYLILACWAVMVLQPF